MLDNDSEKKYLPVNKQASKIKTLGKSGYPPQCTYRMRSGRSTI